MISRYDPMILGPRSEMVFAWHWKPFRSDENFSSGRFAFTPEWKLLWEICSMRMGAFLSIIVASADKGIGKAWANLTTGKERKTLGNSRQWRREGIQERERVLSSAYSLMLGGASICRWAHGECYECDYIARIFITCESSYRWGHILCPCYVVQSRPQTQGRRWFTLFCIADMNFCRNTLVSGKELISLPDRILEVSDWALFPLIAGKPSTFNPIPCHWWKTLSRSQMMCSKGDHFVLPSRFGVAPFRRIMWVFHAFLAYLFELSSFLFLFELESSS